MQSGTTGGSSPSRVVVVKPWPHATWTALAVVALVLTMAAIGAQRYYTVQVRLSVDRRLPATTVLATMAAVGLVSALIGRGREWLGLCGMVAVSFGASASWLLLDDHRFAGPVVWAVANRHGIHLGDLLSVVPATVGLLLLGRAARLARLAYRRRHSSLRC